MIGFLALLALVAVVYYLYTTNKRCHNYWANLGIKFIKPIPILGNTFRSMSMKLSFVQELEDFYKRSPNDRYIGLYQFFSPTLLIRDLSLIKRITVKDFDHFTDHPTYIPPESDRLWNGNMFAAKGDHWRMLRHTLSPSFTGSKMKMMYGLMTDCAARFTEFFREEYTDCKAVDVKDMFTRYTNDVIATCAFGTECDALRNPTAELYVLGREATDFSGIRMLKFLLYGLSPKLMMLLKIKIFSTKVSDFFTKLVTENIREREKTNLVRPDMIHLLMQARKGVLKNDEDDSKNTENISGIAEIKGKIDLTDEDIVAQAMIFFTAGFETTSTLMTFMAYELAVNPDIQERLRNEIDDLYEECNGKITYDKIQSFKYLDMVLNETLRLWPPAGATDRICNKTLTIEPELPGEVPLTIEKGTIVWLPIYGIHRDPQYYENPDKFNPERFSDENKNEINPSTFLSFGIGPRICIGSRFALLETKVIFCYLLRNFEFLPNKTTQIPMVLSKRHFDVFPENGLSLDLRPRAKTTEL